MRRIPLIVCIDEICDEANPGPAIGPMPVPGYRIGRPETGSLAVVPVSRHGGNTGRAFSIRACRPPAPNRLILGSRMFFQFRRRSVKYRDAAAGRENCNPGDVRSFDIEIVH